MTAKRVLTVIMLGLLPCIFTVTGGCDGATEVICFLDTPESSHQLSPDGRAVAFNSPNAFDYLLYNDDYLDSLLDCRFDCVVREFTRLFRNNPDSLIIVLDSEQASESCTRLALERGYDYFEEVIPYEIMQECTVRDSRVTSHNRTFRAFETGVGLTWPTPFTPGPPTLRGYSFLMSKGGLDWGAFLHEFCHHWAAFLDGPPALADQIERSKSQSHWGYSSVGGQLGGWMPGSLMADENGMYHANASAIAPWGRDSTAVPYAPLELYLMGLVGPEEVPPIEVVVGHDYLHDASLTDSVEFPASSTQTITIDAIIKANGPRLPAVDDSPKHFKLALVVLTDHELSDAEWDDYARAMDFMSAPEERFLDEAFPIEQYPARHIVWERFTGVDVDTGEHLPYLNFYQATGGRSTIEFAELVPK